MIRRLPRSTRTDTLCPYTTLFRSDFVASASLDRDQVSAGAVDLRPSRTWRVSVAYEHHFGKGGAIVVEARHESIADVVDHRSEEHTSELQSLMRISYAVFCLKKTKS